MRFFNAEIAEDAKRRIKKGTTDQHG